MAQVRMSEKLKDEMLSKILKEEKSVPRNIEVPETMRESFEKHFLKPGVQEWLNACPDKDLLQICKPYSSRIANNLLIVFSVAGHTNPQNPIPPINGHYCARYREELYKSPNTSTTLYAKGLDATHLIEKFSFLEKFTTDYLEITQHNARISNLALELRDAMENYKWANGFVKEVEQAKFFMPAWAIAKMEEKVIRTEIPKKTTKLDEETLNSLKQQLVSHALIN